MLTHKDIFNRNSLILCCSIALIFLINQYQTSFSKPKITLTKEQSAFNFSTQSLKLVQFGHSRLTSSLLWMITLLESDIEHYKGDKNSWMYFRFLTISELEPRFYLNYLVGGQYLSIIKDDIYGADDLYTRGLRHYPNDFRLNFHAAFNAAFEIGDIKRSLIFFDTIVETNQVYKGPSNLLTLINKLKYEAGEVSLADSFEYLSSLKASVKNPIIIRKIEEDLYAIKAELDLNCLNARESVHCNQLDYDGTRYIKQNGQWVAQKTWIPYKVHKK